MSVDKLQSTAKTAVLSRLPLVPLQRPNALARIEAADAREVPVPRPLVMKFLKAVVASDKKAEELLRGLGGCTIKEVLVLVCGTKPLLALQQAGYAPKNRTVASLREKPIARNGGHYLVTYDPAVILSEPAKREIIDWDVRLAHRLLTTGTLEPTVGHYEWVGGYAQLIADVKAEYAKTGKPVKVSFDSETMGLYPWYPNKDFVCCSFSHRIGYSALLYLGTKFPPPVPLEDGLFEQMQWLFNTPMIRMRMANGKYDLIWVKEKWDIDCTNFTFDTLLVGSLLAEDRSNSLNLHAKIFTPIGGYDDAFNRKFDKAKMEDVPLEDMRVYQGGDTDSCLQAADVLQAQLDEDPRLKRFYVTVLHPAARAFEKIERRGILVDQEKFAILRQDLQAAIKESTNKQMSLLPVKTRIKYKDRIDEQLSEGKNPLLPSIVKEFFFTLDGLNLKPQQFTDTGKISLSKGHLRQVAESNPAAAAMVAEMTVGDVAAKTLSTFVDGFLKHLRPDGRWHRSYLLFHGGYNEDENDEGGTLCVTADTRFLSSRGYAVFSDLKVGDGVIGHSGNVCEIVGKVYNGIKPILQVRLADGRAVKCTENHPLLCSGGWKNAGDLATGDLVTVYSVTEQWAKLEGWPYDVSTWGSVRSHVSGKELRPSSVKAGYLVVTLYDETHGRKVVPIHVLVAEAFCAGSGPEVRHLNGIPWDNCATNLSRGSRGDNAQDAVDHGSTSSASSKIGKLDWGIVETIRTSSESDTALAEKYGVAKHTIWRARNGVTWSTYVAANKKATFGLLPVAEVIAIGSQPTFGVVVSDDHSHVTNGIVTHNTGRLSARDPAFQALMK